MSDLYLVHFDGETDTGEATLVYDLADGDYGAGHYAIVDADNESDAAHIARTVLFGDGDEP